MFESLPSGSKIHAGVQTVFLEINGWKRKDLCD